MSVRRKESAGREGQTDGPEDSGGGGVHMGGRPAVIRERDTSSSVAGGRK